MDQRVSQATLYSRQKQLVSSIITNLTQITLRGTTVFVQNKHFKIELKLLFCMDCCCWHVKVFDVAPSAYRYLATIEFLKNQY